MSQEIERTKFKLESEIGLQSHNHSPHEGRLVSCGASIASQKLSEGLKVYKMGSNGSELVNNIEEGGSYAYLDPIQQDNLRHI